MSLHRVHKNRMKTSPVSKPRTPWIHSTQEPSDPPPSSPLSSLKAKPSRLGDPHLPQIPRLLLFLPGEASDSAAMALEWVVLGYAAGAEAIMLLLLTLPGLDGLRRGMISVVRSALKPMMSVVPFCLFLLMDIYWKYETRPTCDDEHHCTPSEHLRHQKSIMKSQRNALLIAAALLLYWILFSVTSLVVRLDQLQQRVDKLKKRDD